MRSAARRLLVPGAALLLVVGLATPTTAGAEPPPPLPTAGGAVAAGATPLDLTLITGDKVTVAPGPGRAVSVQAVERAPRSTGPMRVSVENGDTFVYPGAAMPYLATGQLDKQLFNVSQLVAQGTTTPGARISRWSSPARPEWPPSPRAARRCRARPPRSSCPRSTARPSRPRRRKRPRSGRR